MIWKLRVDPWTGITAAPRGSTILSAGVQEDEIMVWARCDPAAPLVARDVYAYATGERLPAWTEQATFIGTVQMGDGLVFHVFDGGEPDA